MIKKLSKFILINNEILFLFLIIIISTISIKIYNNSKAETSENYKNLINNIYFEKSLDHILNNLKPKYLNISHKVSEGETFEKIFKDYPISTDEIKKIQKELSKTVNLNNLN